jgi:dissimilatory sulfite reductase (desulfoviridin) alpha/beta subunit
VDRADRIRLKQLANDAVIENFGNDCPEARLAEALEQTIEELVFIAEECDHCKHCNTHGEVEDDEIPVDASEIIRICGELKKQIQAFKDYHVKLTEKLDEWADTERFTEPLAEIIEETQGYIDGLEAEVLP